MAVGQELDPFLERVRASGVQHEIVPRRIQAAHGGCRAVHRRLQARAVPFPDDGGHLRQRVDGDFPAFEHLVECLCGNAEGVREQLERPGRAFAELLAQLFRRHLALGSHLADGEEHALHLILRQAQGRSHFREGKEDFLRILLDFSVLRAGEERLCGLRRVEVRKAKPIGFLADERKLRAGLVRVAHDGLIGRADVLHAHVGGTGGGKQIRHPGESGHARAYADPLSDGSQSALEA